MICLPHFASGWTDDDLVAQCLVFFLAGFETVSASLSFLTHEITVNPHIQQKLYEEISDIQKELKGRDLDYVTLSKMKYMDMVMSESMRKWTTSPNSERHVSKAYVLENKNGIKINLKPGDGIWISTFAIHNDEKYFPNPRKFDPERFSDENKAKIKQGTYLPFGMGPSSFSLFFIIALFCSFN